MYRGSHLLQKRIYLLIFYKPMCVFCVRICTDLNNVCVPTSRLKRKICTTYAKPHTLRKVVHIRTQNLYNLRKAVYITQSCTHTYSKAVQPTQNRIHYSNPYKYVRKRRTQVYKILTDKFFSTKNENLYKLEDFLIMH